MDKVWYRNFRKEISRRRKENHDKRGSKRWDPVAVSLEKQRALVDWITEQIPDANIRAEIAAEVTAQRKRLQDNFDATRWAPSQLKNAHERGLLDWAESRLDKLMGVVK